LAIDDDLDKRFKPGLFLQTDAFLREKANKLCSIKDQLEMFDIYVRMNY